MALQLYVPAADPPPPDPEAPAREARRWRRRAVLACVAAVAVPPATATMFLLAPFTGGRMDSGWNIIVAPFMLAFGALAWAGYTALWSPFSGLTAAALWGLAGALPARWSAEQRRGVLVAAGVGLFAGMGVARVFALASLGGEHGAPAPGTWDEEIRLALVPLAVLGAVAGGCLARARAADVPGATA